MSADYNKAQAMKLIKQIVASSTGKVIPTRHLLKDKDADMNDVLHVLKNGRIILEPEPHPKTGRIIYNVEGKTVDGKSLRIPVDIIAEENKVIIVSGF